MVFVVLFVAFLIGTHIAGSFLLVLLHSLRNPVLPIIAEMGLAFVCLVLAVFVMATIEGRSVNNYGLPWRRMFRGQFWLGAGMGFASLSSLVLLMRAFGVLGFEGIGLRSDELWVYGSLYALTFTLVGLTEDYLSFGYGLYTLLTGIGFWPAAILSSALFGLVHSGNPGETWLGVLNAGLTGMVSCLLLRRTGNLWMAVGNHAGWDWAETYFYGVANSGHVTEGHLLNSSISGPAWLSGSTVGPEGSVLCTGLMVTMWVVICVLFREARFPSVRHVPHPPNTAFGQEGEDSYVLAEVVSEHGGPEW